MVSRNKLKYAATSKGGKEISIQTQKRYLKELGGLSLLNKTQERALGVIESRINTADNKEFVENLRSEAGAVKAMNENLFLSVMSENDQIEAYKIVSGARGRMANVFESIKF